MARIEAVLTDCNFSFIKTERITIDFVEKMWKKLRENLWVICGKIYCVFVEKVVLHVLGISFAHYVDFCGKISSGFTQANNREKVRVLHIFHIFYNYYY